MKLTVITNESPFPAIHGGRVDVWRRLQALAAEGVKLQLVFWYAEDDIPEPETLDVLHSICDSVMAFPISRSWNARLRALTRLPARPWYVAVRTVNGEMRRQLEREFEQFGPDAVWLDALFGAELAIHLAGLFKKPMFYRSQNIEFDYRQKQYDRALGPRARLAAWMAKFRLKTFEESVFDRAEFIWDISLDDLRYWTDAGVENIEWLPPFVDPALVEQKEDAPEAAYDFVYLGNLYTPNNVEGVTWFLRKVWPLIRTQRNARLLICGSHPHPSIVRQCDIEGVTLTPDAPSVAAVYEKGRVLINPILSGSGVNVKSLEMLCSGKPVVTCPQGTAGLPVEIRDHFKIASSSAEFAQLCLSALDNGSSQKAPAALQEFTFGAIKPVIERMRFLIESYSQN